MLNIRPAVKADLDGIMEVEFEQFGSFSEEAMASEEVMAGRIKLCNGGTPKWFWVAEHEGRIVGTMILQPTNITPENCTSWDIATDNGMLVNTFDPEGPNIYGVSLAVSESKAPPGTVDFLIHRLLVIWLSVSKRYFMICARMPGYLEAFNKTGIKPEDYWQLKRADGSPQDWLLRFFWEAIGVEPNRFLRDGFYPNKDSGGHGVLCISEDPVTSLNNIVERIYQTGITVGKEMK